MINECSSMSKLTGRLLLFDKKDLANNIFPKDAEILFPERVPVLMEFNHDSISDIIGAATVKKDDIGLTCDIDLFKFKPETMVSIFDNNIYVGGYYNHVNSHMEDETRVIDKMVLQAVSITLLPVDPELKVDFIDRVVIEEKEKHNVAHLSETSDR